MFHSVWDISISVVGQVSIDIGKMALEMPSRSWFVHGLEETKEPAKSKASIWTFISRVKTLEGDARLLYPLVKRPGVIAYQILQFLANTHNINDWHDWHRDLIQIQKYQSVMTLWDLRSFVLWNNYSRVFLWYTICVRQQSIWDVWTQSIKLENKAGLKRADWQCQDIQGQMW